MPRDIVLRDITSIRDENVRLERLFEVTVSVVYWPCYDDLGEQFNIRQHDIQKTTSDP